MDEAGQVDRSQTVAWSSIAASELSTPLVRRLPYVELKLEHPGLEPDSHGERFFPDAVPYQLGDHWRVFYWRPAVAPSVGTPDDWDLACATTHELTGCASLPASGPALVTEGASGTTLVVDGTIAGETSTRHVTSYSPPEVTLEGQSTGKVELTVASDEYTVSTGDRRRIRLGDQEVTLSGPDGEKTTVTPELIVRFPGQRELHHPALGATYRLFPSFGLDLSEVSNPVTIPTLGGELDDGTLASDLGVELSDRPYPERVLWQAFVYTAFDPHSEEIPELTQLETGHIAVRLEKFDRE